LQVDPDHVSARYYLGCARQTHGIILRRLKRPAEALRAHEQALTVFQKLVQDRSDHPEYLFRLGNSHTNRARALRETNRPQEAQEAYREAIRILEEGLATTFRGSRRLQESLFAARYNLGNLLLQSDGPRAAEPVYRSALTLQEQLVTEFRLTVGFKVDLVKLLNNLARVMKDQGRLVDCLPLVERAVAVQEEVVAAVPGRAEHLSRLRALHYSRNTILAELGDHAAAARMAARIPPRLTDDAIAWLNAAIVLASCVELAEKDGKLPEPRRAALAEEYGRQAVDCLRGMQSRRHRSARAMWQDPDLRPLHRREDFRKLVPKEQEAPPNTP
jgi:tetratricopeptide (TPR) repeat protein